MPMNKILKAKWVKALRSGKYKKGTGYLHKKGHWCCLGVLCDLQGVSKKEMGTHLMPYEVCTSLTGGLTQKQMSVLANMNDAGVEDKVTGETKRQSFKDIAAYIEKKC